MPQLGKKFRKKKAVYWALLGRDSSGAPKFAAAVEIPVRWNDKQEEFFDDKGRQCVSKAAVHVDRDVTIGGFMWYGTIASLSGNQLTIPSSNKGAEEIRGMRKVDDFGGKETFRRVFLGGSAHG